MAAKAKAKIASWKELDDTLPLKMRMAIVDDLIKVTKLCIRHYPHVAGAEIATAVKTAYLEKLSKEIKVLKKLRPKEFEGFKTSDFVEQVSTLEKVVAIFTDVPAERVTEAVEAVREEELV